MPGPNHENEEPQNIDAEVDQIQDEQGADEQPAGQESASFLDSLVSDDGNAEADAAVEEENEGEGEQPASAETPPGTEGQPETEQPAPSAEAAADAEEQELLAGVKSERGRERISKMIAERKQAMADVEEFRNMVVSTGMSADDFAQTLQYGRLTSSDDPKNLRVALEMLDQQRAGICQRLGIEVPGVDLLADHSDLKEGVESLEITRERALELARLRKQEQGITQARELDQAGQREMQEFKQQVDGAAQVMTSYLESRKNEADHGARLNGIRMHFSNPENMREFVSAYKPEQWPSAIAFLYNNIATKAAPRPAPAGGAQPLRASPQNLGTPATHGTTPESRVGSFLDTLS